MSDDLLLHELHYFEKFDYCPTAGELYLFYPRKIDYLDFVEQLNGLCKKNILIKKPRANENKFNFHIDTSIYRYTRGEYNYADSMSKIIASARKIFIFERILYFLKFWPDIRMIGISGSVAMRNAPEDDDIDVFIVAAKKRLWTVRLICITVTTLLGVRRLRRSNNIKNKICLNLFFEESEMALPTFKQTEYGAHEVLQMKPVHVRGTTYYDFLKMNRWVFEYFPNATSHFEVVKLNSQNNNQEVPFAIDGLLAGAMGIFANIIEFAAEKLQLNIIEKHRTSEHISKRQLWFFPDDYERKI